MSTLTIRSDVTVPSVRSHGRALLRLEERHVRRALASTAASLAALLIAGTLVHGYQASRPPPDLVTFAFRV